MKSLISHWETLGMGQRNMAFLPAIPKVSMSTRGYHGFMNVLLMREAHHKTNRLPNGKNRRQTESPQTCLNDRGAKEEDEVKSTENLKKIF